MLNEKIDKLISELDTATGMLIVAAMKDKTVRQAKEKIINVSFELGNLIMDIEQEANVGYYANVQGALKDYLRIKTNLSDAATIKELLADVEKIEKTIEEVLKGV